MDTKQIIELKSLILKLSEQVAYLVEEKQSELISRRTVIKMLQITENTYQRYLNNNLFTQIKIGGKAYVKRKEIESLIAQGKI